MMAALSLEFFSWSMLWSVPIILSTLKDFGKVSNKSSKIEKSVHVTIGRMVHHYLNWRNVRNHSFSKLSIQLFRKIFLIYISNQVSIFFLSEVTFFSLQAKQVVAIVFKPKLLWARIPSHYQINLIIILSMVLLSWWLPFLVGMY